MYRFEIALSFAGEIRDIVEQVATLLNNEIGNEKVFYDNWFKSEIAGFDADTYLQDIYAKDSLLVVPFFSRSYDSKSWPHVEWRAIRSALCKSSNRQRLFPLSFGDVEISPLCQNSFRLI